MTITTAAHTTSAAISTNLKDRSWPCPPPAHAWAFVRQFAAEAANTRDLAHLVALAATGLLEVTGARKTAIAVLDGVFNRAYIVGEDPALDALWLPLDSATYLACPIAPEQPTLQITDDECFARLLPFFQQHGMDPIFLTPLAADGHLLGMLAIEMPQHAGLDEPSADLALLIADQLAMTISRARERELAALAERRAREMALLAQVRTAVSRQLSLDDLFHDTVEQTARAFGYPLVSLYLLRGDRLFLQHQVGYGAIPASIAWDESIIGRVARTGQPVLLPDVRIDPGFLAARPDITSEVCVPLRAGGIVCGILNVESTGAHVLDAGDQRLLMALAEQLDLAIEFSQLYDALEARVNQLALVEEISRAVTASLDRDAALRAIVTHVPRAVPCRRLSLASYDAATQRFKVRALWVAGGPTAMDVGAEVPVDETEGREALRSGRLHYAYDLTESPYRFSKQLVEEGLLSIVHVPIMSPDGCLGILNLSRSEPRAFNEQDLALLSSLAPHLATAFKNAELYAQTQDAFAELASAQERNVQAAKLRALGELAGGVAHDFNNLLAVILGHAELLQTDDSPASTRSLRAIIQAAQDGARTVRRIQEFVRAQPEHHSTPVNLADLAEDVLQLTRPRWRDGMQENGATIVIRRELRTVPLVLGDAAELREVVTNLILNALDAMPDGGMLTLTTGADSKGAWVEVRDTGMGIAPETQKRIFEPFYTTKASHGTGLGLAVSRSIALRHGGHLTVQSEPWVGSRFRLTLPVPEGLQAEEFNTTSAADMAIVPLRILLVEDDHAVRDTLARLFAIDGHRVDRARDGAEALRLFRPGAYDVICSDLGMPDMNGWELIARLRRLDPRPVMALLTGWGAQIDPDEARIRGADFVIPKPLDLKTLRAALAAAARRA